MNLEQVLRKRAKRGAFLKNLVTSKDWNESLGEMLEEMVVQYQEGAFNPELRKDHEKYLAYCAEYDFLLKLKALIDNTIAAGESAQEELNGGE